MSELPRDKTAHMAVEMLRVALLADLPAKQEFFLARSIAAIAEVLGIETLLEAVRKGAELSLVVDASRPAKSAAQ